MYQSTPKSRRRVTSSLDQLSPRLVLPYTMLHYATSSQKRFVFSLRIGYALRINALVKKRMRRQNEPERAMAEQKPIGVISIGSNDIHLLVATSDGIGAFDRQANQFRCWQNWSVPSKVEWFLPNRSVRPCKTLRCCEGRTERRCQPHHRACYRGAARGCEWPRVHRPGWRHAGYPGNADLRGGQGILDYCWATFPPVPPMPLLVVDSGGGSTQVILGRRAIQSSRDRSLSAQAT